MWKNPLHRPAPADPTDLSDARDTLATYRNMSDDELRALLIEAGPSTGGVDANVAARQYELVCNARDAHRDSDLCFALVNLPDGPPDYYDTLRALMELRDHSLIPRDAENLYSRLVGQAEADIESANAARRAAKASHASSSASVETDRPADMTVGDWLRIRWASADATVRHSLRTLATSLGVALPMTRRRQVGGKDSSSARRSESELQANAGRDDGTGMPAEREPKQLTDHDDGPQWHDDHAPGWEPCTTLHDALHPENRGWY